MATSASDGAEPLTLARAADAGGEVVLRRRDGVLELVVDGVFAMDSAQTATEEALARLALARVQPPPRGGLRVVVGGLGLGFTLRQVLADERVTRVDVVELHEAIVGWARQGLLPVRPHVMDDERVHVVVDDIAAVVPRLPDGGVDALLLDVDNGPAFLVHAGNEAVYRPAFLARVARALRRGGVVGVWSSEPSPALALTLERVCGSCEEVLLDASRDGRDFTYAVYLGVRTR